MKYGKIRQGGKRNIADSLRFPNIIFARCTWSISRLARRSTPEKSILTTTDSWCRAKRRTCAPTFPSGNKRRAVGRTTRQSGKQPFDPTDGEFAGTRGG